MITPFQILTFLIYSTSIVLAIYSATLIAEDDLSGFVKFLGCGAVCAWVSLGSSIWWLPLFFGCGLGGEFYFGFKILLSEAGLLAGIAALLPWLAVRRQRKVEIRQPLPVLVWLFLGYLAIHMLLSLYVNEKSGLNRNTDLIAVGSIFRNYFNASWGLIFLILFWYYGRTERLIWAFYVLELGAAIRAAAGISSLFWPGLVYLPAVNFILPGFGPGGADDLRFAGLSLFQVALPLLYDRKWGVMKLIHFLTLGLAGAALLLGGGRGSLIASLFLLVFAALYSRRWFLGGMVVVFVAAGMIWINHSPSIIDQLPDRPARTLSILILKSDSNTAQRTTTSSNDYHQAMYVTGWKRWTQNPVTIFFGNGVKPYDWSVRKLDNSELSGWIGIEAAADSGNYEVAIWNVLALMGLVALLCDLGLMAIFCRRVMRLSAVASRDRYGRVFSFMTYALIGQWVVMCCLQGDIPSFEIMMTGLASIYLNDRAREEEEQNAQQESDAGLPPTLPPHAT